MTQLYLDIGQHKSGSLARHRFNYDNRELLARKGVYYPDNPPLMDNGAHHKLCASMLDGELPDYYQYFRPHHDFSIYYRVLKELVDTHGSLLICSSMFQTFTDGIISCGFSQEKISDFFGLFSNAKVIFYVNRPDKWLVSSYPFNIYNGNKYALTVEDNYNAVKGYAPTLIRVLDYFAEFVGTENIVVRPFEVSQWYNNRLFDDYMHIMGIELTDEFILPDRLINASPKDLHVVEIMRLLNLMYDADDQNLRELRTVLLQAEYLLSDEHTFMMASVSPELRRRIFEETKPFYAEIARKYMGREDGRLFVEPEPDPHESWSPYPGLSAEAVCHYLLYLLAKQNEKLQKSHEDKRDIHKRLNALENIIKTITCAT